MENSNETLRESFKKELSQVRGENIFNREYIRKKFIFWLIRNIILAVLYVLFWEHSWVKYTLFLTVPLTLFSLFMIVVYPSILNKKMQRTMQRIDGADPIESAYLDKKK